MKTAQIATAIAIIIIIAIFAPKSIDLQNTRQTC